MHLIPLLVLILAPLNSVMAQDGKEYMLRSILFYNVENLFDTINDPKTFDDDRTPTGKYKWSSERYFMKLNRIAEVLNGFNLNGKPIKPDLIGLCEVENEMVLRDLTRLTDLKYLRYGIIHEDSPDERGIDVALLYRQSSFVPSSFQTHRLLIQNEELDTEYTREQLVVSGFMDGEELFIIVNHWPSRRGGEKRSRSRRLAASKLCRQIIDSIYRFSESPRILIMGDFNDNPTDLSLRQLIDSRNAFNKDKGALFYNPMEHLYKLGLGSLAYKDQWSLFDQIIITKNLYSHVENQLKFWKAGIYFHEKLITHRGRYKGYPYRTFSGIHYSGGYSDHLPVYLLLIKEMRNHH